VRSAYPREALQNERYSKVIRLTSFRLEGPGQTAYVDVNTAQDAARVDLRLDGRDETEDERLDRNLLELLNELRVALPGIQILFGFLLIVPFSQRFAGVTEFQKDTYFVVLLLTTIATALLIAPTALHRLLFHRRLKRTIVTDSNRLAIAGLLALGLAMTGAVLLITDVLFGVLACAVATGVTAAMFAALWAGLPLARRATETRRSPHGKEIATP
jgi:hypothetical protein